MVAAVFMGVPITAQLATPSSVQQFDRRASFVKGHTTTADPEHYCYSSVSAMGRMPRKLREIDTVKHMHELPGGGKVTF